MFVSNSWFLGTCFCCKANPWSFRPTHSQALNFPRPVRWPWNISRGRCMKSWWKSRRNLSSVKFRIEVMKRCTFRYTSPFFPQVFLGVKKVSKVHHLFCFHDCLKNWKHESLDTATAKLPRHLVEQRSLPFILAAKTVIDFQVCQ